MPVPTNLEPSSAIAIGANALPYTATVLAADWALAPTGTGFASTCDTNQYGALWWAYTTGPTETFLSLQSDALALSLGDAYVSIWSGSLAALAQYTVGSQNYCSRTVGGWFQVVVEPNTRYYFQVTHSNSAAPDDDLIFQLRAAPEVAAPGGSVVVPNDENEFPVVVMDATTGDPVRVVPMPANEFADTLPSCIVAIGDFTTDFGNVTVYQGNLTTIVGSYTATGLNLNGIKSNRLDKIYFIAGAGAPQVIGRLSDVGTFETQWTLPADSIQARCFAVTQDNTIVYYASRTASAVIHAYDLVNDVALPDLHAAFGTEWIVCVGDGIALVDGSVLFAYGSDILGHDGKVRRFNAAGTVLNTYTIGLALDKLNRFCYVDEYSFLAWSYSSVLGSNSVFRLYKISDGTLLHEWTADTTGPGGPSTSEPVAIGITCPVFVLPYSDNGSLTTPGSGGCGLAPATPPLPDAPNGGTPTGPVDVREIRRQRILPHMADTDAHRMAFFSRLELILQTGQAQQTWCLEVSTDGGYVYGPKMFVTTGLGQYAARAIWNRLPRARDMVLRFTNSDNCKVVMLDALIQVEMGLS